jgi:hypothetical protein
MGHAVAFFAYALNCCIPARHLSMCTCVFPNSSVTCHNTLVACSTGDGGGGSSSGDCDEAKTVLQRTALLCRYVGTAQ